MARGDDGEGSSSGAAAKGFSRRRRGEGHGESSSRRRRTDGESSSSRSAMEIEDSTLLHLSENHISQLAPSDTANTHGKRPQLYIRAGKMWDLDPTTESWVDVAGFKFAGLASRVDVNQALMHALAERWQSETHSFHLPYGEMTITLQDVQMILGLRIDGLPVTDDYRVNVPNFNNYRENLLKLCDELLGVRPEPSDMKTGSNDVYITWLKSHFDKAERVDNQWLPVSEEVAQQRARGYILALISSCLFSSTSGGSCPLEYIYFLRDLRQTSQYSWGSAVLSYMYRGLCSWVNNKQKDMHGCGVLLQVWCWEHIGVGKPRLKEPPGHGSTIGCWWVGKKTTIDNPTPHNRHFYRDVLKTLVDRGFTWNPWTAQKLDITAPICKESSELACVRLPLIHFNCVEWQLPDRVYQQFDLEQPIPESWPDRDEWNRLHKWVGWKKMRNCPWYLEHATYIALWNNRRDDFVLPNPIGVTQAEYRAWYDRVTRSYIHRNPPPPLLEQDDDDALITLGHYQELGNANQVLMQSMKFVLKNLRKFAKGYGDRDKRHVESCIGSIREGFIVCGQLSTFQQQMEEPLISSDDEVEPRL